MAIRARKLKMSEIPGKTELYEVRNSREIVVEERQADNSLDQVILEYSVEDGDVGYFAGEYRPPDVPKTGAKVIDITAVMMNQAEKCVRWHLYDIKDALAGENTVVKLYNQWNAGLGYLRQNILLHVSEYSEVSNLGVITRYYDEERMERLKNEYQKICDEIGNERQKRTLPQMKKRAEIAKYRGILKAALAILNREFQTESGSDTYGIHVRLLNSEDNHIYRMEFPV